MKSTNELNHKRHIGVRLQYARILAARDCLSQHSYTNTHKQIEARNVNHIDIALHFVLLQFSVCAWHILFIFLLAHKEI